MWNILILEHFYTLLAQPTAKDIGVCHTLLAHDGLLLALKLNEVGCDCNMKHA